MLFPNVYYLLKSILPIRSNDSEKICTILEKGEKHSEDVKQS